MGKKREKSIDHGVIDKRRLCKASEFASILKVLAREGNTLSAVMRDAWDGHPLRILTKNSPARATDPHVSVIAHITSSELIRLLNETEQANGFGNRFLYACTRKSKCLPEGGQIKDVDFSKTLVDLKAAVDFGRESKEIPFDDQARVLWHRVYPELSSGQSGMFGALTGRAEAQVRRIACIYALFGLSELVKEQHLRAALAVWRYSEDSCRFVFGNSIGDPVADKILSVLRASSDGLSRTDIRDLLGRNSSKPRTDAALGALFRAGLARFEQLKTGAGRPTEWWFAVSAGTQDTQSGIASGVQASNSAAERGGLPASVVRLPLGSHNTPCDSDLNGGGGHAE